MPAVIVEVADAVAAALNAASLSLSFTAVRAYGPVFDLQDMGTLRVTVVPRSLTVERMSRRDDNFAYTIDVAVQQRVADKETATLDPYMLLVEEIVDLFRGQPLAGYTTAANTLVENDPIYLPDLLDEQKVFTSVVRLTFTKARGR